MKRTPLLHLLTLSSLTLGVIFFQFSSPAFAESTDAYWKIKKDHWSRTDERRYSEFVQAIGESHCHNTDECLKNPANPYRNTDAPDTHIFSDCADLPYILRAYFAWKNGLPFGYVSEVSPVEGNGDLRYSPKGNQVSARVDVVARRAGQFPNGARVLQAVSDTVSSAMFRFDPQREDSRLFTDHYSAALSRDAIRPGTIIYDPNGHVTVIYRVETDGRVLFMDAHPDNSLTRGTYGKKFARSNPGMGAGFKNWRPIRLVDFTRDSAGNLIGGKLVGTPNSEISDYSVVQYFGTVPSPTGRWSEGGFITSTNETVDYYDYVRQALATGNLRYEPISEFKNMLDALCQDTKDRATSVQLAIAHGIDRKAHPGRLPDNIYGTSGEWEEYSSPSRDARLKTSFKEARDRVEEFVRLQAEASPKLDYSGDNLKEDLLAVYQEKTSACTIDYTLSDGVTRTLNLDQVIDRLFELSFDPYVCIERRWGETEPSILAACADDDLKRRWHEGEQWMRNQIDRTYGVRMDFTVNELFTPGPGNGVQRAPDVNLLRYLSSDN